jgi:rubredoxin
MTTPKTAPSYIEEKKEAAAKMTKYECTVCSYVYDPELGDPDGGIKPGTPFEKLPNDWVCPVCGADKDEFKKIVE